MCPVSTQPQVSSLSDVIQWILTEYSTILLLEQYKSRDGQLGIEDEHFGISWEKLWPETRTALDRLTAAAASYIATCRTVPDAPHIVPIFLLHVMYQVTCLLLRLAQTSSDGEIRDKIATLRLLLGRTGMRWRLSGEFRTHNIAWEAYN